MSLLSGGLSPEATIAKCIVLRLTGPGLKPQTVDSEHDNHYTIDTFLLQIEHVSWWNYILVYQIRTFLFNVRWYLSTNKQSMTFTLRPSQFVITVIHISLFNHLLWIYNRINGVMVSVLAVSVVDRGFEPWSGQTKDYKIGTCCLSTKHAALRSKSKDWLARNQNNVSEWSECVSEWSECLSADCCFSELAL
jgi:hypothetical protein